MSFEDPGFYQWNHKVSGVWYKSPFPITITIIITIVFIIIFNIIVIIFIHIIIVFIFFIIIIITNKDYFLFHLIDDLRVKDQNNLVVDTHECVSLADFLPFVASCISA